MDNFLIDTHCHLNLLESDLASDLAIENAQHNNVLILNNICTNVNEMPKILDLSNKYDNVFCSVGHHPEELLNGTVKLDDLLLYTKNSKVVAIGESGLDYHYGKENRDAQLRNFELHIQASRETKLPLIIHTRDSDSDMIKILESEIKNGHFEFVLHCFSSGKELAYKGLDLGGFISISGIITFKNANELRSIVKNVPIDRMIVETDAPYLAPVPFRGHINQPAYVSYTAKYLSELLLVDYREFCFVTTKNSINLFKFKILNSYFK